MQILPIGNSSKIYQYSDAMQYDFLSVIREENIYRTPFRFLVDLGLVNILVKIETKIIFTLETNLYKLC